MYIYIYIYTCIYIYIYIHIHTYIHIVSISPQASHTNNLYILITNWTLYKVHSEIKV